MAEPYIRTVDLCRYYDRGHHVVKALDHVSITVDRGQFLGIVGSSGSGKTTLLNLLAGLDTPTSGMVDLNGTPLSKMSRRQLSAYRAQKVGMIFQSFNLISHYTALQNVETALYFSTRTPAERRRLAAAALEQLGLADRITHRPADLSGGEQQRVAVARAVVKNPEILYADEPTGNLDFENSAQIATLLTELNKGGLTIVMVTHNLEMAQQEAHRTIRMQYGHVVEGTPSTVVGEKRP
ncbi:MAG: macrolide transporter ATP-binding protein [Bacteroidetes bacterium]|jgi:putative ABC transport system ATP-binding protein|nr:macrolide transporter ATP-binding protein [Bacteroidota bacterium]